MQQRSAVLLMTLFDFELLCREDQLKAVHADGVYIGKRKEDLTYLLYQVESFYVEIAYRKYRYFVEHIRTSASTAILEPYLDEIQVNHITGMKPQN